MKSVNTAWKILLRTLLNQGKDAAPRNKNTKELLCHTSTIDMNNPIMSIKERNVSYNFMFAEAWWILTGRNDVKSIAPYAPSIGRFSDNGKTFRGAYGPKVIQQIDYVVDSLTRDLDSRQAIMTIWERNPRDSKDIPCTLSLQFLLRGDCDTLHCVATMRSSDAWIGFIYDVFTFSCIAACIAAEVKRHTGIDIKLGTLHLTAGSQHLYEENFDKAKAILSQKHTEMISPVCFAVAIDACDGMEDVVSILEECKDRTYEAD